MNFKVRRAVLFGLLILSVALLMATYPLHQTTPEIHCKHFFYGYPTGTPETNDLIIRDSYALSSNDTRKFADWVAYQITPHEVIGTLDIKRKWRSDPWLDDSETLEGERSRDDYRGVGGAGYDRGHQAPLAAFKGSRFASQTNFMSNITPQMSALNQGPWQRLEAKVRTLVKTCQTVYVMTGPLYERPMTPLPNANEAHTVPSGYWKIILVQLDDNSLNSIRSASYIFEQETPRSDSLMTHLTTINEVENRSGLDFLRELPNTLEQSIQADRFVAWAEQHFND